LENDAWEEEFLVQIEKEHSVTGVFADDYKVIGFSLIMTIK
jgi:type III restriction-modification enzyme